jgi:hypothetical protein
MYKLARVSDCGWNQDGGTKGQRRDDASISMLLNRRGEVHGEVYLLKSLTTFSKISDNARNLNRKAFINNYYVVNWLP